MKQTMTMTHILAYLLVIIASSVVVDSRTYSGDIQVLKDLKNCLQPSSIPAGSCLSSWDFTKDPCDHVFSDHFTCGLRCDRAVAGSFRVSEITLDPVGYSGTLSSITWNLPYLQILDISDNLFSGSIPDSFSNLTRLRRLILSGNSLTGEIPASLGSLPHLEELYLNNNHLCGTIPEALNGLTRLKRLELQENYISGDFPDLGSLKNLYFLDVSANNISGELPATMPASLVELSIRNNNLQGNLPDGFRNLQFLQVLDLSHNQLSGPVPAVLFEHPSLQQLTLSHNGLNLMQVPASKGAKSRLIALDLSYNEIGGLLPAFVGTMPELSAVSLEHNKFTGMIPAQYAIKAAVEAREGTSSFERLLLGGNYLFGPIPGALMGLKPGSANVSLVDNCLYRCPDMFFFCQGGNQKSLLDCKTAFGPAIP